MVKDDVVRAKETLTVKAIKEPVDVAGFGIDSVDPSALEVQWSRAAVFVDGNEQSTAFAPGEATVVDYVERSIGADGGAVRATAGRCDLSS